jgi:hypothetical protein
MKRRLKDFKESDSNSARRKKGGKTNNKIK